MTTSRSEIDYLVLDARVFSLRVFANKYRVDIIIWCLVPFDRDTRSNVCEQVEGSAQSQVQGNVSLSDFPPLNIDNNQRTVDILGVARGPVSSVSHGGDDGNNSKATFQCNSVSFDRIDGCIWDNCFSALQDWRNADFLPVYGDLHVDEMDARKQQRMTDICCRIDIFDRFTDLRTNA